MLAGNRSQLTTLKRGDETVAKAEKQIQIVYDEESILNRLVVVLREPCFQGGTDGLQPMSSRLRRPG